MSHASFWSPSYYTDGDLNDLTTSKYLYPGRSGYETVYGHTDAYGDQDMGSITLSSTGYYDLSSTGNTSAYIYDATAGNYVYSSSGSGTTNLYLNSSHTNYAVVYGYTYGQNYSVTLTPHSTIGSFSGTDGDYTDLTTSKYVYPNYGGYQTVTGHTDSIGDWDSCNLILTSSGYYNITSTGNTHAYIYDASTATFLAPEPGSTSTNLYVNAQDTNYLYIIGNTRGESYSVTVLPSSNYDGDSTDLTTSKYVYPNYGGYQTVTGHTDYISDWDYANVIVSYSGYYSAVTDGNTHEYFYDATAGSWLSSSSGSGNTNVYLTAGHSNYVYLEGYTPGQNYSLTIYPHG